MRFEMRDQAHDPERSRQKKNNLLQGGGAILPASQSRDATNGHAPLYFPVRQRSKPGGHNRHGMPHPFELVGNVRAGIPRAAANRRILTVKDKDSHTKKIR